VDPQTSQMNAIRILIADDHEALRNGVKTLIEQEPQWSVCGMASTGREAVELAIELKPNVVVLDVLLPDRSGLEVMRRIKRTLPQTEIVIFSGHFEEDVIRHAFAAGARSFVLKAEPLSSLAEAIRLAADHKPFFTERISEVVFSKLIDRSGTAKNSADTSLSDRERDIVQLLAGGKSNKQVAAELGISVRTAEAHRSHILRKLGLDSIADLVRYAIRHGLIKP
jgi:two-component system, NarL family, response regulator NreC